MPTHHLHLVSPVADPPRTFEPEEATVTPVTVEPPRSSRIREWIGVLALVGIGLGFAVLAYTVCLLER